MQIEHIAWQVNDPLKLVEWYTKNLGLTVVRRGKGPSLAHFLADSTGHVILEIYLNPVAPIPDYPNLIPQSLHLAFVAEDVKAVRDALVAEGATIAEDVSVAHSGDELLMLRDPWGFPLQFVKRVEPML